MSRSNRTPDHRAHNSLFRLMLLAAAILMFGWQVWAAKSVLGVDSPSTIRFTSAAGDVEFMHEMHSLDFEISCAECHHETDARELKTPHTEYLENFSIDCHGCHHESVETSSPQACSRCHHEAPADIADETLSSKVVIHQVCWECHEIGHGSDASSGCAFCHQRGRADK
jgi:hypothetical protein